MSSILLNPGLLLFKSYLGDKAQGSLLQDVRKIATHAPMFSPVTPWGKPMRVKMTSAGKVGWYADRKGYRYEPHHPGGQAWPPIPASVLRVWKDVSGSDREPECCLVNYYDKDARMGLHQDKDEADFSYPVVSISLGDRARFRFGGKARSDATRAIDLESGDVVVMSGEARLAFHGIDRIYAGSSTLLDKGGRLNLTLRVVT